ncbi:hypothetical protein LPJ59_005398 [Coemansia sp. RSA 2399]|nr:hypothetical protein LPJ59_005398 [Coemansia sp. RSA 2399]
MSETKIKPETVEAIFKRVWERSNTSIRGDALELSADFLLLFAKEALDRAKTKRAESGGDKQVDESDLEKILAQLLLDF